MLQLLLFPATTIFLLFCYSKYSQIFISKVMYNSTVRYPLLFKPLVIFYSIIPILYYLIFYSNLSSLSNTMSSNFTIRGVHFPDVTTIGMCETSGLSSKFTFCYATCLPLHVHVTALAFTFGNRVYSRDRADKPFSEQIFDVAKKQ